MKNGEMDQGNAVTEAPLSIMVEDEWDSAGAVWLTGGNTLLRSENLSNATQLDKPLVLGPGC